MSFAFYRPACVEEAVALAQTLGPTTRFIAGGTDLIIQLNRQQQAPEHVIDLTLLRGLNGITEASEEITIGALTTHKQIERHVAFQNTLKALAEAARVIGGHQIRNIATIGGNIANASPAADLLPPLLAFDARLDLVGPDGTRELPLRDFLIGPRRTARIPEEIIRSVRFLKPAYESASVFLKAGRRKAMEISVVSVATQITLDPAKNVCRDARIAIGAAAPTALRIADAEGLLRDSAADDEVFEQAGKLSAAVISPVDDVRASAEYRRILVAALVPRALRQCRDHILERCR